MDIKTVLKSSVAAAALFAVAAPVPTAQAADDTLKSGKKQSNLTISGQVVSAISFVDDGESDEISLTDGRNTATRVRWIASGKLNENVTAGATIEINLPVVSEAAGISLGGIGTNTTNADSDSTWDVRHQYVWVKHKKFGKITFGHTDSASNSTSELDYSGTCQFSCSQMGATSFGDNVNFIETAASGGVSTGKSISALTPTSVFTNFDGASRRQVLRYDTPRVMGLMLKTSLHNSRTWDVAADYAAKFGAFKVGARVAYYDRSANAASTNYTANGSASVIHDSGLNFTVAWGKAGWAGETGAKATNQTDFKAAESPEALYFGLGYRAKLFGVGGTDFVIKYQNTTDLTQATTYDDSDAEAFAITAIQSFDAIGASIGIQYINMSLDAKNNTTDRTFDDIDSFALMTIFKF